MLLFLKSLSRTVHEVHDEQEYKSESDSPSISLTVWRKSLLFSCHGFTVIGSGGNLVFRVDNYTGRSNDVTLMDGSGKPILTVCRRKKLRLVDNWLVYEGEVGDDTGTKSSKKPICCVRKHINILQPNLNVLAYVYHGPSEKRYAYVIEGSYAHRSCKLLDESRRVMAEIKKKEAMIGGVTFGLEVFLLIVQPGFDLGFAMGIVLLLDQMFT
ncbi:unnamed protein product [Ilex paraguariensis]|uniref:Protein LURP-one-related 17 n=1 Tax=Ilex paraguariensis TaxID=185542 RepID=A0ABC8SHA7_9AQUA